MIDRRPWPERLEQHLQTVHAPVTDLRPWDDQKQLPYFLLDHFEFLDVELLGQRVILAFQRPRQQVHPSPQAFLAQIEAVAQKPVVYVTDTFSAALRRQLIQAHIPFIVPGSQMFLWPLSYPATEDTLVRQSRA
jgi:hypothetical protein